MVSLGKLSCWWWLLKLLFRICQGSYSSHILVCGDVATEDALEMLERRSKYSNVTTKPLTLAHTSCWTPDWPKSSPQHSLPSCSPQRCQYCTWLWSLTYLWPTGSTRFCFFVSTDHLRTLMIQQSSSPSLWWSSPSFFISYAHILPLATRTSCLARPSPSTNGLRANCSST